MGIRRRGGCFISNCPTNASSQKDLKTELSDLIILTASRTLLGREIRENLFERVSDLVHDLDVGMVPLSVIFPYAPIAPHRFYITLLLPTALFPMHRQRDRARKELGLIFGKVIRERRASGRQEADMLDSLIKTHYRDGRQLSEEEITGPRLNGSRALF